MYWVAFAVFVTTMLTLDLFVFHRKAHEPTLKESAWWTVFWCSLAIIFNVLIWYDWTLHPEYYRSPEKPNLVTYPHLDFLNGYLVEWALSVDNVFVFAVVFGYFRVPLKYQYRVLFWGILGAIIMRLIFIWVGAALLHYAEWMMPIFGGFLIYTGIKLAFKSDEEVHPENNIMMRLGRKLFRVTNEPSGDKFFRKLDGKLYVTPLFLVLLVIESTDLIFAIDSVPAILGITRDTFIVFTSNIFAIMGLRALYFLLAGVMDMFRFLNYGLSAILIFVGLKMGGEYFAKTFHWVAEDAKVISPLTSLLIVVGILTSSILASVLIPHKHEEAPPHPEDPGDVPGPQEAPVDSSKHSPPEA